MHKTRPRRISFLLALFIPLSLFFWEVQELKLEEEPVAMVTATAVPVTSTLAPSETAVPATAAMTATNTATATHTPTRKPSATPTKVSATATNTPTATATAVRINRRCPETAPTRPEYDRYVLDANPWPQPDTAVANPHFWLAKPIPGGGRYLVNQTFPYGYDLNGRLLLHNGVDAAQGLGIPVLAVANGTVVVAQADDEVLYGWRCDWYGHLVVVELAEQWLDQPVYVLYGHVLSITVEVGQEVYVGDQVAEVGFGGAATVPHLHFEVRVGTNEFSSTRNPMLWIAPGETRGVIAGRLLDPQGRPWQGVVLSLLGGNKEQENRTTWSYLGDPDDLINADEGWAENFVFSDVRPGNYEIYTKVQGVEYRMPVTVAEGDVATVEIITEAYKTPTATPPVTATPTPLPITPTPTAVPITDTPTPESESDN
jgi:murein DD-endopeptidase MepM/ murein hydrolase activator NlpD